MSVLRPFHITNIIFDITSCNLLSAQKHGFKCANKQLVVRKDGLGVVGMNAPLSPTNDAKRLKIVRKKNYPQPITLASTSIFTSSSSSCSLISGPGFSSSNAVTIVGATGGISDTGMRKIPLLYSRYYSP